MQVALPASKPAPPTFIPVTGLVYAVRSYFAGTKSITATAEKIESARDVLRAFGDRHDIYFDFAGEPEGKFEE